MNSKLFLKLLIGVSGSLLSEFVSADAVDEFTSLAGWTAAVNNESVYTFSGASGEVSVFPSSGVTFGPGAFSTPGNATVIWNDGLYGSGEYVSASPNTFAETGPAIVDVSFNPTADVTALAFTLGSARTASDILVSVNGSALAPLTVSSGSPTAFLGVTDTTAPITNIKFTDSNFQCIHCVSFGEMDLINNYSTARAIVKAPEIDPSRAASGLTVLLCGLAVLSGRKQRRTSLG